MALPTPSQTALPTPPQISTLTAVRPSPSQNALPTTTPFPPSPTATQVLLTLTTTPLATPTVEDTLTPDDTATPADAPADAPATVWMHPDGGLYVGDEVSFEVYAPQVDETSRSGNHVVVRGPDGNPLGTAGFGEYGLGQRVEAMLLWAWDTRGLEAGDYRLTFTLEPAGSTWTQTVTLLPQAALPWPEPQAHWATARSQCCMLHYITGTAAERDLPDLLQQADEQARDAVQRMGIDFTAPITITLLSRLLGHGGFASQEIAVTYLDRNYAGSDFGLVLHHEMIHILDGRLGGDYRPSLFVEGLAVYKSGGHFKTEPLMPRAAALLASEIGLGWYIPLAELADHFYLSQHEIGYLEGAALIEYMVNTWGWDAFSSFYRDIRPAQDNSQASAIDAALQKHFQVSFAGLEAEFMDALGRLQVTTDLRDDMRLTVEFFDTVRRYQQLFDPSAYFQTAWLVDTRSMRSRGIVADYLRHPAGFENLALETLLSTAYRYLSDGQYASVDQVLAAANAVLNAVERGDERPFAVNDQAGDYYAIVQAVRLAGYEVQRILLDGDTAHAWVTAGSAELVDVSLVRGVTGWGIAAGIGFAASEMDFAHLVYTVGQDEYKNGDLRGVAPPQIPILEGWAGYP